MNIYIALLRAIGGKYTLPSNTLVGVLESLGLKDVKTCIATGNAVFRARTQRRDALAAKIQAAIHAERGFAPQVLLLTPQEMAAATAKNPFREAQASPATLHLVFLSRTPPDPDLEILERLKQDGEEFLLDGKVFYVHTPNGAGRSKLFARGEKSLGVWGTARNWRSACNILALAERMEDGE